MGNYSHIDGRRPIQNPIDRTNDPSLGIACGAKVPSTAVFSGGASSASKGVAHSRPASRNAYCFIEDSRETLSGMNGRRGAYRRQRTGDKPTEEAEKPL